MVEALAVDRQRCPNRFRPPDIQFLYSKIVGAHRTLRDTSKPYRTDGSAFPAPRVRPDLSRKENEGARASMGRRHAKFSDKATAWVARATWTRTVRFRSAMTLRQAHPPGGRLALTTWVAKRSARHRLKPSSEQRSQRQHGILARV